MESTDWRAGANRTIATITADAFDCWKSRVRPSPAICHLHSAIWYLRYPLPADVLDSPLPCPYHPPVPERRRLTVFDNTGSVRESLGESQAMSLP
jgi:hypothetical protein